MKDDYYYVLEGHKAVKADLMTWARMFEANNRVVAQTDIGDTKVSTVFLGLDHQYGEGPPLLFETMIFSPIPELDQWQDRCTTLEQAETMHESACERVRAFGEDVSTPKV